MQMNKSLLYWQFDCPKYEFVNNLQDEIRSILLLNTKSWLPEWTIAKYPPIHIFIHST